MQKLMQRAQTATTRAVVSCEIAEGAHRKQFRGCRIEAIENEKKEPCCNRSGGEQSAAKCHLRNVEEVKHKLHQ
jgi:hypothetical protein